MILYHGSYLVVKQPQIIKNEKGRDFGCAFYLTPIKEQAERMARRKQKQMSAIKTNAKAIVNIFEWDESKNNINFKEFLFPDEEWLNMILSCRSNANYEHGFDIVVGKIADDSVGETVNFVLAGIMRKEDAIERLKFQKINSQIAFCSEEALKSLKFVDSYEVK